jgi:hypothetical protein
MYEHLHGKLKYAIYICIDLKTLCRTVCFYVIEVLCTPLRQNSSTAYIRNTSRQCRKGVLKRA